MGCVKEKAGIPVSLIADSLEGMCKTVDVVIINMNNWFRVVQASPLYSEKVGPR